jgi:hypothetical protein
MRCEIYHNFLFTRMKYINLLNEQIKANIKYKMKIEELCLHGLSYSPNITVTKTKKSAMGGTLSKHGVDNNSILSISLKTFGKRSHKRHVWIG